MKKCKSCKALKVLAITAAVIVALALALIITNAAHRDGMEKYIDTYGRVDIENQLTPEIDERGCTILTVDELGGFKLEYSNYYSGEYDNLTDGVDMTLPEAYN